MYPVKVDTWRFDTVRLWVCPATSAAFKIGLGRSLHTHDNLDKRDVEHLKLEG